MSEKIHQTSTWEYQLRIDGGFVESFQSISEEAFTQWLEVCKDNPDCYVDIVRVNTEIIISQGKYLAMKQHFDNLEGDL